MNDDLGDVFRHLADEAPSDEGLLAGVRTASARAAVRRRVLLSSAAALAVLVAGVGVVTARGDADPPPQDGLVVDPSDTPSPEPSLVTLPTPQASVSSTPTTYHGRAVSTDGEPIAGLYVHVIPGLKSFWFNAPVAARTDERGEFDIPCPSGAVLLSPFRLGDALRFDTPNWRVTYVGGGYLLGNAKRPACTEGLHTTEVPEGAVIYGALRAPEGCKVTEWAVHASDGNNPAGHIAYDQYWLRTIVAPGAAYRLAGLPPGSYSVYANDEGGDSGTGISVSGKRLTVTGPGRHEVTMDASATDCGTATATPTPSGEPSATPTSEPSPEPTPSSTP